MDFNEALKHLKEGKKVRLKRWKQYVYLFIGSDNLFWIAKENIKNNGCTLSEQPIDKLSYKWILSEEWEIYYETKEVTEFIEDLAFKAFNRYTSSCIGISTFCDGFKAGIKDFCEVCETTPEQLFKRDNKD